MTILLPIKKPRGTIDSERKIGFLENNFDWKRGEGGGKGLPGLNGGLGAAHRLQLRKKEQFRKRA